MGWEQLPPEIPVWRQEFNACSNCERLEVRVRELEANRDDWHKIADSRSAEIIRLESENARLREAIKTHKNNVWGRYKVEHHEDVVLYEALEE